MNSFADIVLPLAQPAYCFAIPEGMELHKGEAVAVQFGPRNIYTGIVWRTHNEKPAVKRIKSISHKLYKHPLLDERQMAFWEWMADYYMCSIGEVMRMALPALAKPKAASEEEFREEEFKPKTEQYISLAEQWQDAEMLRGECRRIERRAPRRKEILERIASFDQQARNSYGEIPRRLIECDSSMIAALKKAGYINLCNREIETEQHAKCIFLTPKPTPQQAKVLQEIHSSQSQGRRVHLLHGITGSGKTEIYMDLIGRTLAEGGDVMMLVPEIALTAQLIERMEQVFGGRVTAYHSKLSNRRRAETYIRLTQSRGGELIIGARSALFLPLRNLKLIVVDEEHDASYKQSDTAPRYQGRDCAIMLASIYGAFTLMGSATPSIESYANGLSGKYGYSTLKERYGNAPRPRIIISDTIRSAKRGERKGHINIALRNAMDEALSQGEQVILFQNRRGFAPFVACPTCGWTMRCPHCNVTMSWHRTSDRMECHYCGHTARVPRNCPHCKTTEIEPMGFGTEKIEQTIAELYPDARVARLDRDTSTSESAYNRIIGEFADGKTNILIGTQMVTKGFDFDHVGVVGILNADNLLFSPDFRSSERAFQLMTQVAGRAGRRQKEGVVVIQTSEADNPVIGWVAREDYYAMARSELAERHAFGYPPYSRIVKLTLRDREPQRLRQCAVKLAEGLRRRFGGRVIGPVTPPIDRIRGLWIVNIILKIEVGRSMKSARELLRKELSAIGQEPQYKQVSIAIDVDAQ